MQEQGAQAPRSAFVTVLAWIFIVLAGFATLISILQNIMIYSIFSHEQMHLPSSTQNDHMPAFFAFMFEHFQLVLLTFLVVCASTFIAAVGLLHRKNWARIVFVAILGLGILWNAAGLILQQIMFSSLTALPAPNVPTDFQAEFDKMASVMRVVSFVLVLGFCTLFAWLIKRLLSKTIRAEFVKAP